MNLTPREKDKLLVSLAAMVARGRLARGVKLNHPEAIALITDFVVEGARDGRRVADLMEAGAHVITRAQCMEGVPEMIHSVNSSSMTPDIACSRREGKRREGRGAVVQWWSYSSGPTGHAFAKPGPTALGTVCEWKSRPNGANVRPTEERSPRWAEI